ncbi:MAG: hypothetical protein QG658_209 [Patescibacteria group bacterium]|nr:hypothetical protein [Patescibacteria group bacterium]
MNVATYEQRATLSAHRKRERVVRSPLGRKISAYRPHAKHLQAALMILFYFAAFGFFFQTSRAEFEEKSLGYLEANQQTRKTSSTAEATTKPNKKSEATAQTLFENTAPSPEPTEEQKASAGLPPYNTEDESAPSIAEQFTSRGYAFGHCTYYVAKRRPIPQNWGNARDWLGRAKAAGFVTGVNARPGAIAQTTTGRWGHVAYVEKAEAGKVYVSEYNYVGWNRLSYRWANESEFKYIY